MVLTVLTVAAMEAGSAEGRSDEELPPGFLEFLGGMVEVESAAGTRLVDPLDLQQLLEAELPAKQEWDETAAQQPDSGNEVAQ